jgi:hypothetical protein
VTAIAKDNFEVWNVISLWQQEPDFDEEEIWKDSNYRNALFSED